MFLSRVASDYRPSMDSPLLESGQLYEPWPFDFIGQGRPLDADLDGVAHPEIGLYEFTEQLLLLDESPNQTAAGRIRILNEEDSIYAHIRPPGFGSHTEKRFSIHPNPIAAGSERLLILRSKDYLCPEEIWIQHLDGRKEAMINGCQTRLDVSGLVSGVYLLRVLVGEEWEAHRFVVE